MRLPEQVQFRQRSPSQIVSNARKVSQDTDLLSLNGNILSKGMYGIERFERLAKWENLRVRRCRLEVFHQTVIYREFDQEVINLQLSISNQSERSDINVYLLSNFLMHAQVAPQVIKVLHDF